MNYFSNQELADTYHVSVRTVRNWIESARAGKIDLTLHTKGAHEYVIVSTHNISVIEKLVLEGKKFRPHRAYKTLVPKPEFYDIYTPEQIHDLVSNMVIHHEIPPDYNYFGDGAKILDAYVSRLAKQEDLNGLSATTELLQINSDYIDSLLSKYDKINVIDVGVGNALPAKGFLGHLLRSGKLNRYIALDISNEVIDIARKNIETWFEGRVKFEGYQYNFNYERFNNLLTDEYLDKNSEKTANVILFVGGTMSNLRTPEGALLSIHDSMGIDDFLIYRAKLDTPITRKMFDVDPDPNAATVGSLMNFVVNLLNIDKSLYEVELGYDVERKERYERLHFKMAITIKFAFDGGERLVNLNKDDTLLVYRSRQQNALDVLKQFDRNNFYTLHSSQTDNYQYILTISKVKLD